MKNSKMGKKIKLTSKKENFSIREFYKKNFYFVKMLKKESKNF